MDARDVARTGLELSGQTKLGTARWLAVDCGNPNADKGFHDILL
jgi:hypothetical protein